MPSPHAPTKYLGPQVFYPATVSRNRRPTSTDVIQPETGKYYILTTLWQVGKQPTTGVEGEVWILTKIVANVAFWELFTSAASGTVVGLKDNFGTTVGPDDSGFINVITANSTLKFIGSTFTLTLDFGLTNLLLGSNGSITTGAGNVGIGLGALGLTTIGGSNFAGGLSSLASNVTGSGNTACGNGSLQNFNPGTGIPVQSLNTCLGNNSLNHLLTGTRNLALGNAAGFSYAGAESSNILLANTGSIAESNTIRIGTQGSGDGQQNRCFIAGVAGVSVSNTNVVTIDTVSGQLGSVAASGFGKTITGDDGLALSPSGGNWNIVTNLSTINSGSTIKFTGSGSTLTLNVTDAISNTILGKGSGNATITGTENSGFGKFVFTNLTTGTQNTSVGKSSSIDLISGNSNSMYGFASGAQLQTGSYNIFFGNQSGYNYNAGESSNIVIGNTGNVGKSNQIIIGTQGNSAGQQDECYIAGIANASITANQEFVVIDTSTGQLGSTPVIIPSGSPSDSNIGLLRNSSTSLTLTSASGVAFGTPADNIGYVTLPSFLNPGTFKTYEVTADITTTQVQIGNNLFGLVSAVNYANVPFFIYAVSNYGSGAETTVSFFLSRYPNTKISPVAGKIGISGSPNATTQGSFFAMDSSITVSDYASSPALCIGSLILSYASSAWTFNSLGATDGIGMFQEGVTQIMPVGQFGADTTGYFKGASSPKFSVNNYVYELDRDNRLYFATALGDATVSAGSGGSALNLALPFNITTGSLGFHTGIQGVGSTIYVGSCIGTPGSSNDCFYNYSQTAVTGQWTNGDFTRATDKINTQGYAEITFL